MGHLLSTVNPQAAEDADSGWKPAGPPLTEASAEALPSAQKLKPRPDGAIPTIGHIVVYHLRDGDSRNRRIKFPAVVMDSDPETGTLKLWVIVDDGDTWMQDHVPARVAPEPGWELVNQGLTEPPVVDHGGLDLRPGHITWAKQGETMAELIRRIEVLEAKNPFPPEANITINREHVLQKTNEHLFVLDARISALEAKRGPGRPAKPKDE